MSRDQPEARAGPQARASGCLKESMTPWGACAGAGYNHNLWTRDRAPHAGAVTGFLAGLFTPWGPLELERSVSEGDCNPMEGTHAGAAHEEP